MTERKYVRFRVDMYEDTKFKIIDLKPERDVIYYIWSRIVMLSGKVNLEGELFLSKNIPYTIETLAIEFNRSIEQVKLALEVFIELQMLELTEDSIYKLINFAKHQNIKVKEKETSSNNKSEEKSKEVVLDKIVEPEVKVKADVDNVQKDETLFLDTKKNKKTSKNKKDKLIDKNSTKEEFLDEVATDEEENGLFEGDVPLRKGEIVVDRWSFG